MNRTDTARPAASVPIDHGGEDNDGALLARIAQGDMSGFEVLVDRYKARVFRFIHVRVGEWHTAQDLSQETFLRLFRAARGRRLDGRGTIAAWLFTIARHCTIDHLRHRSQRRTEHGSVEDGGHLLEELASADPGPPDRVSQRERVRVVRALLQELPAEQREVIELKTWAGLTFAQVAEVTGRPITTVKSQMAYGLNKLARRMPGREEL
ncbi:MAG: sigma-70 family RNA polymerase sigma factor [Phycisphaerales bacterium]